MLTPRFNGLKNYVETRCQQIYNTKMRKEVWSVDNIVHLTRRGGRGMPIVKNDSDRWRYLKILYYLNDIHTGLNTLRDVELITSKNEIKPFEWPKSWPRREPLFSLCAFTLLDNHDHIIGLETKENGISKFMHKSGISMAKYNNFMYSESGSLFQGPFDSRVINSDKYLLWVAPYVMCKNTFEMHPKGFKWAAENFDEAWKWATQYPFSSLGDYAEARNSPIVDTARLKKFLGNPRDFKNLCKDMVLGRKEKIDADMEAETSRLTDVRLKIK